MQSASPLATLPTSERFVIQELLGSGGAGAVYRAYDRERDATVALKVLSESTPGSLVRFKQEFRALSSFVHPNVVHLYELITRNEQWLLTMELIDGTDLLGYVRPHRSHSSSPPEDAHDSTASQTASDPSLSVTTRHSAEAFVAPMAAPPLRERRPRVTHGELDEARLRSVLRQLCHGLDAIHRAGHLHRDLKPSNVLVSHSDGRVAICDFGLVLEKAAARASASSPKRKHRQVAGTLPFMSPEQLSGEPLSAAADWYSVGVMLYLALTLRMPFGSSATVEEAAARKRNIIPQAPRELIPELAQDLSDLAMALLRPEPELRPGFAEVMAVLEDAEARDSMPVTADLLIGREEQMAQLMGALARARNGSASIVFVSGRSGMGKSMLVQRFLDQVEATQSALVLKGRCYEREELPYKTLDPIMDALSAHLMQLDESVLAELLPAGVHNLARLFPAFLRVPAIAQQRGIDATNPHEQKRRAVAALRELFQNLAQQRLLVLYIDDLQWGDLDSGPILAELLRPPHPPALLLVCAHRSEDEEKSALLRELLETHLPAAGMARPPVVKVDALLPADARHLAKLLLGSAQATPAMVERVASEARGSPMFLHELAAFVRRNKATLGGDLRLDALIEMRVSQLTRESRKLLEVIVTAGRPERRGVVLAAAQLGDKALVAFHLLETQHLVRSAGTAANDRVEASHDRIRETVYRMLADASRRQLHRELALAIEREDSPDPEALFDHWKAADEPEKAGQYALAAAERSEAALAFGRAAQLYQAAQQLLALDSQSEGARSLEQRLGYALMYAGHGVAASEAFFRALPGAVGSNAIELRILAISQLLRAGRVRQAFQELRHAESLIGMRTPRSTFQTVVMLLWRRVRVRLCFLRLRRASVDQLRLQRLDLLWGVGSALSVVDHIRGSVYQTQQMLLALNAGDPYRLSRALSLEATVSATNNRNPGRTQWLIDRGLEAAGMAGNLHGVAVIKGTAGVCRLLEGKWREAIRLTQEGIEIMQTRVIGMQAWEVSTQLFFHVQAQACVGNVRELTRRIPELLRDAEARDDLYAATCFRSWRCSWAWLGPDQPDSAREQAAIAEQQWAQDGYHLQHWYLTLAYGEIDLYTDTPELAWKRLNAEWRPMFFLRQIQHTRCEAMYLRARLALALARKRHDPQLLASARRDARLLVREGVGWSLAFGRLIEASCMAFKAPAEAASMLREVEGQFDALDMTIFALACRYRRGQLIQGPEGTALIGEASEGMHALGVTNSAGFVRMLAPGFPTVEPSS